VGETVAQVWFFPEGRRMGLEDWLGRLVPCGMFRKSQAWIMQGMVGDEHGGEKKLDSVTVKALGFPLGAVVIHWEQWTSGQGGLAAAEGLAPSAWVEASLGGHQRGPEGGWLLNISSNLHGMPSFIHSRIIC
jgi:hypothetical protein